jgi:CRISPR-associated protein Csm1
LGLVDKTASCNDFSEDRFAALQKVLFASLERAKLARFNLTGDTPPVFAIDYPYGVCQYNDRLRADKLEEGNKASARLSRDQITIGEELAHQDRLLITRDSADLYEKGSVEVLETPIFGYRVGFTQNEAESGRFGELARSGDLLRCWDFSLPENLQDTLWHGYARRYINAHVPEFRDADIQEYAQHQKYAGCENEEYRLKSPKTFNHIAWEDRQLTTRDKKETWIGQIALATLKGDVDNLGRIFQQGLSHITFAKMAALSRQLNAFFAIWLPAYCAERYPDTYTVFAGGDDFFLIGPWRKTQELAADMATHFKTFVAENPEIHFSVGFAMTKPGYPIHALAEQAESALETAKGHGTGEVKEKNAVCLYNEVVPWPQWNTLTGLAREIDDLSSEYALSTGYVYGLLSLIDLATSKTTESAMWRSRFAYRTRRYVVDKLKPEARTVAQNRLADTFGERGIAAQGGKFRIPLFNFFYSKRG